MTRTWQDFTDPERETARQLFVALTASTSMAAVVEPGATPRPAPYTGRSISQAWHAIVSGRPLPSDVEAAGLALEDLSALLDRASVAAVPRQAAAATDPSVAAARTGRGVTIRLAPSRSDVSQTYVTLEFDDRGMAAGRLIALRPDGAMTEIALPTPVEGAVQLLVSDDDPALVFLADTDCRIYLV